jgi:disulfide bond formation protein DsbB
MADTPVQSPRSLPEIVLAFAVLALVVGPIGTAVFVLGFVQGDSPCILCWAQRTAMVLIAVTGLFILRYGPRPRYVGLAMLVATWGVYMGIRHSALHLARDIGQGFSLSILGAHTYTWSFFIFWVTLVLVGALVAGMADGAPRRVLRHLRPVERLAGWLLLLVVAANAAQAFASTGPPPYVGQSDPVRFSWNPAHWVWSMEEWSPAPIGWRGRFSIPRPDPAGVNTDAAAGPIAGVPVVSMRPIPPLMLSGSGPVTDLAYDPATDRFAVTGGESITILSGTLDRVLRRVTIDPGYSVDLSGLAGAAFLDSHTVMALSQTKSYVIVRENDSVDQNATFRFFLDNSGRFEEITRGRFATVRARMNYVLSLAWDGARGFLYTVSVPNPRSPRFVVSRFDRGDMTLSEEFLPRLDPASGLQLQAGRALDEYVVTAATFQDGRLYALSASYRTLLTVDPATHLVAGACGFSGPDRPAGLAIRNGAVSVIDADGRAWTAPLADFTRRSGQ